MKIGLVLTNLPTYSETFFHSKMQGLAANGHQVILFIGKGSGAVAGAYKVYKQPPVYHNKIIRIFTVFIYFAVALIQVPTRVKSLVRLELKERTTWLSIIRKIYINYHIIVGPPLDWLHFGFATVAIDRENIAKAIGAKMAVSLRGYDISLYPIKNPGCYDVLWQKIDKLHTISDDLLEIAYKNNLPKSVKVQKIPPAINVDFFCTKSSPRPLPQRGERVLTIVTIARLHWKKGLEYTLEAMALLKKNGINFNYYIIGSGTEYERLAFAAHQLGISDSVHFTGKLSHDKLKQYLEFADLYIQYSIQEGFCNAVLEAQAMGMLCVVSDAEGLSENVLHNETGWVVPRRQPLQLAKQIELILTLDPNHIELIRQKAAKRVQEEFNIQKQQQRFLKFYDLN